MGVQRLCRRASAEGFSSRSLPGVDGLTPARFALGLSTVFRTTPGLIFFYSSSGRIAVMSSLPFGAIYRVCSSGFSPESGFGFWNKS